MNTLIQNLKYGLCVLAVTAFPCNAMAQSYNGQPATVETGAPVQDDEKDEGLDTIVKVGIGVGIAVVLYNMLAGGPASNAGSYTGASSDGSNQPTYFYEETTRSAAPAPAPITPPISSFYGCSDGSASC